MRTSLLILVVLAGCNPGPVPPQPQPVPFNVQTLLNEHNLYRSQNRVGALKLNKELTAASQLYAEDMAHYGRLSHTGRDGSSPAKRAARAGYPSQFVGENIAEGYPDIPSVMTGWKHSPGHNKNILLESYTDFGAGFARAKNGDPYWVVDFGATSFPGYATTVEVLPPPLRKN